MPPVKNLQLLLVVLLPLAALTDPVPGPGAQEDLPEISGEGDQSSTLEHHKWHKISEKLLRDITKLRDEQFQRDFGEPVANMSDYSEQRIQTPLITPSDRCLSKNFGAQNCLRRIYAGLRTYREYLSYVERENLTSDGLTDIRLQTTILLNMIKDKMEDTQIQPTSIDPLPEGSAWNQKIVAHSVLYNFAKFLTRTTRAIIHINNKRIDHIRKEIKWPLEKHLNKESNTFLLLHSKHQ